MPSNVSPCRFPPPWTIDEANNACFIVRDNTGQAIGYFHLFVPKPPLRVGIYRAASTFQGRTPDVATFMVNADQKSSVRNPQSATLTSSTDHSEAFSQNSLPSHSACAIIVGTRCWTGDFCSIPPATGISCSAQVTHRLNLASCNGVVIHRRRVRDRILFAT